MAAQHHQKIAHHCSTTFGVEFDNVFLREHLQSVLDHADSSFDDSASSSNDCPGLLALQHGCCNFGRVSKIADAGIDDLHASLMHALLQLVLELCRHCFYVSAQRMLVGLRRIIAVPAREISQGRVGLHVDEFFVIIHLKQGSSSIRNLPNYHRRNFDRRPVLVVDLQRLPLLRSLLRDSSRRIFVALPCL